MLDCLKKFYDARSRYGVIVESHGLESALAIVATQFVTNSLYAPIGDPVC